MLSIGSCLIYPIVVPKDPNLVKNRMRFGWNGVCLRNPVSKENCCCLTAIILKFDSVGLIDGWTELSLGRLPVGLVRFGHQLGEVAYDLCWHLVPHQ